MVLILSSGSKGLNFLLSAVVKRKWMQMGVNVSSNLSCDVHSLSWLVEDDIFPLWILKHSELVLFIISYPFS